MSSGNILILGSNSFSGTIFSSKLPKEYTKHLVYRTPHASEAFKANVQLNPAESEIMWNLNDDPEPLIDLINDKKIETIVNFAAQSMVGQSWDYPEDWYQANVYSFAKLLTKIRNETDISRFIQFSTPEVYGSTDGWIRESFNFAPTTPYAVSRAASDWHLKVMHETLGFPVIFTRAANVYGEHQQLYRIVPRVIISGLTGRKIPLQGAGKSIRSFIHMDDVSDALVKIIDSGTLGNSYHISTNNLISIFELVSQIASKLDIEVEDLIEIVPDRQGKDNAYQLESNKIRTELNWSDKVTLSQGIDRTIRWIQDNLEELAKCKLDYEHRK